MRFLVLGHFPVNLADPCGQEELLLHCQILYKIRLLTPVQYHENVSCYMWVTFPCGLCSLSLNLIVQLSYK